jgi:hypothetical protein
VRIPPISGFDENKKSKMKTEQLLNINPQEFEGSLKLEKIQERLTSLFLKETPKRNQLQFIKKIQKTFEIREKTHNTPTAGFDNLMEQVGTFESDSFQKGLCFRVPLTFVCAEEDQHLFDCTRFYLKLYIKSENFDFFGKNLFHKYNMNKIISIYSPIRKYPERSIESLFEEYFQEYFAGFQKQLKEYGKEKMWIKETVIDTDMKENRNQQNGMDVEEVDYQVQKEFYEVLLENSWLVEEIVSYIG